MSESLPDPGAIPRCQVDPDSSASGLQMTEEEKRKFIKKFGFSPFVQDVLAKQKSHGPGSVKLEPKQFNIGSAPPTSDVCALIRRLTRETDQDFSELEALATVKVRRRTAVIDDSDDEEVPIECT